MLHAEVPNGLLDEVSRHKGFHECRAVLHLFKISFQRPAADFNLYGMVFGGGFWQDTMSHKAIDEGCPLHKLQGSDGRHRAGDSRGEGHDRTFTPAHDYIVGPNAIAASSVNRTDRESNLCFSICSEIVPCVCWVVSGI